MLIAFMFALVGLLLYSISARDPLAPPGLFDRLQLALVVSALIIDVLVLPEITGRITEYGTTPNKAAALGENVILLASLIGGVCAAVVVATTTAAHSPAIRHWRGLLAAAQQGGGE